MRLIDADKLYPDSVSVKGDRLCISQSQLAGAPTIDIKKLRKEMEEHIRVCYEMQNGDMSGSNGYKYQAQGLQKALDIINKYFKGDEE